MFKKVIFLYFNKDTKKLRMILNKIFLMVIIVILSFSSLLFAHSGDTLYVPYGIQPTIDGQILPGEWDDADTVSFPLPGGPAVVFFKQNPDTLYIAIDLTDGTYDNFDNATIYFDCNNDGGNSPQPDDYGFGSHRGGMLVEFLGTGSGWNNVEINGWNGAIFSAGSFWQVEYSISFSKLGIIEGVAKTIGFETRAGDNGNGGANWPPGASNGNPDSWGDIISPNNWASLDTIPPGSPQNLRANGSNPSPWSNNPGFEVDWTNPPDPSGIKRSLYKRNAAPTTLMVKP